MIAILFELENNKRCKNIMCMYKTVQFREVKI